jgi:hypothetical protein
LGDVGPSLQSSIERSVSEVNSEASNENYQINRFHKCFQEIIGGFIPILSRDCILNLLAAEDHNFSFPDSSVLFRFLKSLRLNGNNRIKIRDYIKKSILSLTFSPIHEECPKSSDIFTFRSTLLTFMYYILQSDEDLERNFAFFIELGKGIIAGISGSCLKLCERVAEILFSAHFLYLMLRSILFRLKGRKAFEMLLFLEEVIILLERFSLHEPITTKIRSKIPSLVQPSVLSLSPELRDFVSRNNSRISSSHFIHHIEHSDVNSEQANSFGSPTLSFDCLDLRDFTLQNELCAYFWDGANINDLELSSADPLRPTSVRKTGGSCNWRAVKSAQTFDSGIHRIQIRVDADPVSSNAWRTVIGVVPTTFEVNQAGSRCVGGTKGGWGLICGTGLKYHRGSSQPYSTSRIECGDIVTVVIDMNSKTIGFELNGIDLGIAFDNLADSVQLAVSLTSIGSQLSILDV